MISGLVSGREFEPHSCQLLFGSVICSDTDILSAKPLNNNTLQEDNVYKLNTKYSPCVY
jgi:hypothetical protein